MKSRFQFFIVIAVAVAIALAGISYAKFEGQNHRLGTAVHQLYVDQSQIKALAVQVAASKKREAENNTTNVTVWCGAINEGRREGLRLHGNEPAYKVRLLDCAKLEKNTALSATPVSK
jgi:hypothetical protein